MKSRFFLTLGIALIFTFGALAAFYESGQSLPQKEVLEKELLVQMHERA